MTLNWDNAIWLAIRQIRDLWTSHVFTAIYFLFMGAILAADDWYTAEFAHPVLILILIQPAVSSRYMSWKQDNDVVRYQQFLRSVPLGFGTIVVARLLGMMFSGVINVPLYFVWYWFLVDDWTSLTDYLAWVVFWTGLAFAATAFSLVQEFWISLRRLTVVNLIIILIIFAALPPMLWLTDFRPMAESVDFAIGHPWLAAIMGVMIGMAGLCAGVVAAVRCFRQREYAL